MDIERTCALYHPGSETGQSKVEAYNFKMLYCLFPKNNGRCHCIAMALSISHRDSNLSIW